MLVDDRMLVLDESTETPVTLELCTVLLTDSACEDKDGVLCNELMVAVACDD